MSTKCYEYISKIFKSNCLFEAIKAKRLNPTVKIYRCKPSWRDGFMLPHFMWSDGIFDYDFSDTEDNPLPWYRCFWFKGRIRRFDLGFAKTYSEIRNNRKVRC